MLTDPASKSRWTIPYALINLLYASPASQTGQKHYWKYSAGLLPCQFITFEKVSDSITRSSCQAAPKSLVKLTVAHNLLSSLICALDGFCEHVLRSLCITFSQQTYQHAAFYAYSCLRESVGIYSPCSIAKNWAQGHKADRILQPCRLSSSSKHLLEGPLVFGFICLMLPLQLCKLSFRCSVFGCNLNHCLKVSNCRLRALHNDFYITTFVITTLLKESYHATEESRGTE